MMVVSAGEKNYPKWGVSVQWVTEDCLIRGCKLSPERGRGPSLADSGRRRQKCSGPGAGVCLEHSRLASRKAWLERSERG